MLGAHSVLGTCSVLAEPLCSAKASVAAVRQQWEALFCLLIMYGVEETVDFLKETCEDAILSGDRADFSICIVFWLNAQSISH